MKKIYLLCLLVMGLSACGGEKTDLISLSGEIKGLGNDTIYLYGADRMHDRMDTLVAQNDKFSTTLSVDTLVSAFLLFGNGTEYPLFLDKGNHIEIKGSMAELATLQIGGNTFNKELTDFNQALKGLGTPSDKVLEEKAKNFIAEHPASLVSIYLLEKYFVQVPRPDLEQIQELTEHMTGELKDRPLVSALLKTMEEEEKVTEGKTAPYFRIKNAKGEEISRNTFKDKYLLIQFWASWDTLSRAENAMLRRIYKKEQKNKNFALLSISLDIDRQKWLETIKADTLKWEQVCDFAGWNSETTRQFAIRTLPANLLLSPSGRIEKKNLDEEAIQNKLKEIAEKEKEEKEKKKASRRR